MSLRAIPMTIKRAKKYVRLWHRHHSHFTGGLFAIAVARAGDKEPCGVAVIGRCPARILDQRGDICEITRLATDGTPNVCSKLYGMARRIVGIMGYARLTTQTELFESGGMMRAVGFKDQDATASAGGSWDRDGRPRQRLNDRDKQRWTETLRCPDEDR